MSTGKGRNIEGEWIPGMRNKPKLVSYDAIKRMVHSRKMKISEKAISHINDVLYEKIHEACQLTEHVGAKVVQDIYIRRFLE